MEILIKNPTCFVRYMYVIYELDTLTLLIFALTVDYVFFVRVSVFLILSMMYVYHRYLECYPQASRVKELCAW